MIVLNVKSSHQQGAHLVDKRGDHTCQLWAIQHIGLGKEIVAVLHSKICKYKQFIESRRLCHNMLLDQCHELVQVVCFWINNIVQTKKSFECFFHSLLCVKSKNSITEHCCISHSFHRARICLCQFRQKQSVLMVAHKEPYLRALREQ